MEKRTIEGDIRHAYKFDLLIASVEVMHRQFPKSSPLKALYILMKLFENHATVGDVVASEITELLARVGEVYEPPRR